MLRLNVRFALMTIISKNRILRSAPRGSKRRVCREALIFNREPLPAKVQQARKNAIPQRGRGAFVVRSSSGRLRPARRRLQPDGSRRAPRAARMPRYRLSAIAYRLSPIAYRLSATGYRLLPIGYRLSAIAYRLSAMPASRHGSATEITPSAHTQTTANRDASFARFPDL